MIRSCAWPRLPYSCTGCDSDRRCIRSWPRACRTSCASVCWNCLYASKLCRIFRRCGASAAWLSLPRAPCSCGRPSRADRKSETHSTRSPRAWSCCRRRFCGSRDSPCPWTCTGTCRTRRRTVVGAYAACGRAAPICWRRPSGRGRRSTRSCPSRSHGGAPGASWRSKHRIRGTGTGSGLCRPGTRTGSWTRRGRARPCIPGSAVAMACRPLLMGKDRLVGDWFIVMGLRLLYQFNRYFLYKYLFANEIAGENIVGINIALTDRKIQNLCNPKAMSFYLQVA